MLHCIAHMKTEYSIAEIAKATGGKLIVSGTTAHAIQELLLDSRKLIHPTETIFFALGGLKLDGHNYIDELYKKGVRNFVVSKALDFTEEKYPDSNFILVKNTTVALQKLTATHRAKYTLPVIAVTGSNGKTVVKEWLYQLLHEDYNIIRSPKSYNSQIGVPLSVWPLNSDHNLAIFEAGISESGEMDKLEKIIKPDIGVFTNIGEAHSEGFLSPRHKTKEKLNLFVNADILIYCKDYFDINQSIAEINALSKGSDETENKIKTFTWSLSSEADVQVGGGVHPLLFLGVGRRHGGDDGREDLRVRQLHPGLVAGRGGGIQREGVAGQGGVHHELATVLKLKGAVALPGAVRGAVHRWKRFAAAA